jgi:hypothetical protein
MLFELFVVGTFWFWSLIFAEFLLLVFLLEKEKYYTAPLSVLGVLALIILCGSGINDVLSWVYFNPLYTFGIVIAYFVIGILYVVTPFLGKWWWFVRDVRDHNRDEKARWLGEWKEEVENLKSLITNKHERIKGLSNPEYHPNVKPEQKQALQEKYAKELQETQEELLKLSQTLKIWEDSKGVMTQELLPLWKAHEQVYSFYDFFNRRVTIQKPTPDKYKGRITAWLVYWPPSLFWTLLNDPLRRIGRLIYEGVAKSLARISDSAWKDEDKLV